jgi:Histidine kinase
MSASPLETARPPLLALAESVAAPAPAAAARVRFLPYVWVLTAFWAYVAVSNLLYANNMQASLSSMKIEHVFAPSGARLLQHLILYPLFILCMWRSLRIGWTPLWRTLPVQLLFGVVFAVLASPALNVGELLTSSWYGTAGHPVPMSTWSWSDYLPGREIPTWVASASNFLINYCFGLALATGLAFYQRLRDAQLRASALERALTQAHLAALRMQLSPHTLFNLLHTIRGQITWDPPAAQTMVVQLGDLLRRLLTAGEREFSRLSDEVQFVTLYLELQQKRFADRLAVSVPQRAGLPQLWVPSLILQPLVENAVVHGLAGHEQPVTIEVEAQAAGETLTLRVSNTIAHGKTAARDGIGLANVRERLLVQFGERATFSAGPAGADLWVAQIVMPLLRDGPDAARTEPGAAA